MLSGTTMVEDCHIIFAQNVKKNIGVTIITVLIKNAGEYKYSPALNLNKKWIKKLHILY